MTASHLKSEFPRRPISAVVVWIVYPFACVFLVAFTAWAVVDAMHGGGPGPHSVLFASFLVAVAACSVRICWFQLRYSQGYRHCYTVSPAGICVDAGTSRETMLSWDRIERAERPLPTLICLFSSEIAEPMAIWDSSFFGGAGGFGFPSDKFLHVVRSAKRHLGARYVRAMWAFRPLDEFR